MLQSTLHAIHFKHILNFGERQAVRSNGPKSIDAYLREHAYGTPIPFSPVGAEPFEILPGSEFNSQSEQVV
jgi:hypothetical protein